MRQDQIQLFQGLDHMKNSQTGLLAQNFAVTHYTTPKFPIKLLNYYHLLR